MRDKEIYYFRDQQGLEIDFIIPLGGGHLAMAEIKASRTVTPQAAGPMIRLMKNMEKRSTSAYVVYQPGTSMQVASTAIKPHVKALSVPDFIAHAL